MPPLSHTASPAKSKKKTRSQSTRKPSACRSSNDTAPGAPDLNAAANQFSPWRPSDGKVFTKPFAFDTETTLIDEAHHWIVPAYVLGAAYDGSRGVFVERQHLGAFLDVHERVSMVMHNAVFDLAVIHLVVPALDIYRWVDQHRVWDTRLLHRLLMLGTAGTTASGRGESSLETCAEKYLNVKLPKDVVDSKGRPVRLSYARWLNRSFSDIEPVYLEYLAQDAVVTHRLYSTLRRRLREVLDAGHEVWGFISPEWLQEQVRTWGPQTHHIQLQAEIVLREITAAGLHVDGSRRQDYSQQLEAVRKEQLEELRAAGYLPGKGPQKALQAILARLERQHPELDFPRTPSGTRYATTREALAELAHVEPFVQTLLEHLAVQKLLNTFIKKMGRSVLHASFNVLARTGRTTSFGEINAQNLPRDDRVRNCFVPSPGQVFLDLDYKTVELATLAQAVKSQFGLHSRMGQDINAGRDLHCEVAAEFTGKPLQEVTADDRQKAKAVNFGKPGGMGNTALKQYALATYHVKLADHEVETLSNAWLDRYPEMRDFLADSSDLGQEIAALLGLTPQDHFDATGSTKYLFHPANDGREALPHAILGGMALKTFKLDEPTTAKGRYYEKSETDYFWDKLADQIDLLPQEFRSAVLNKRPSVRLQRAVMRLVGRAGVFTLTGRLRANATYSARHNTVFQALAADGAKLALWLVWRAGYRIVNFVHDELLVEVPEHVNLALHAEIVRRLMISGMRSVVPDVRIDADYTVSERWSKKAQRVWDEQGRLVPWRPSENE